MRIKRCILNLWEEETLRSVAFMNNTVQKRFRVRIRTNIFLVICHNLRKGCPASVIYKALGIPPLIQTPLLPPHYSLLPAICIHLHDFTMCISFVLTVWWCRRNPPRAALLHSLLKATWILNYYFYFLKKAVVFICYNYKIDKRRFLQMSASCRSTPVIM